MTENALTVASIHRPVVFQSVRGLNYDAITAKLDAELPDFPDTFPGDPLVFNGKRGNWQWGHGKNGLSFDHNAYSFVFNIPNSVEGWQRFLEDPVTGKLRPHIEGLVAICDPAAKALPREALGDTNPEAWPLNSFNKQEDPWKRFMVIPVRVDGQDKLNHLFVTSISARIATQELIRKFAEQGRSNMGKLPVVNIGRGTRKSKDGTDHDIPVFEIVAWVEPTAIDEPTTQQDAINQMAIPDASVSTQARTTVANLEAEANKTANAEIAGRQQTVDTLAAQSGASTGRRTAPAAGAPAANGKPGLFVGAKGARRTTVGA